MRSSGRKAESQFLGKKTMLDRLLSLKGFWLLHQMMRIRVVRCIRDIVSDGERKCLRSFVKLGIKLFNLRVLATCFFIYLAAACITLISCETSKRKSGRKERRNSAGN
jgi:hypothetical protein